MDIPFAIAAERSLLRQNVALSVIKQTAQQSQQLVKILDQSADALETSGSRGTRLNIRA